MQRNTLLFLILSLAIMAAYGPFLKMMGIETPQSRTAVQQQAEGDAPGATAADSAPAPPAQATLAASAPAPKATQTPAAVPAAPALTERQVVVETDLYRAVFSTRGAVATEWRLKTFFADDHTTPINLVNPPAGDAVTRPLALLVDGAPAFENGVWSVDRERVRLKGDDSATLTFRFVDPASGAQVTKAMTFHGDGYAVDLAVDTQGLAADYTLSLGSNFGIHKWGALTIGFVGVANLVDGDVQREDPDDMAQPLLRVPAEEGIAWTVSQDKYFLTGLLPREAPKAVVSQARGKEHVVTGLVMADGANGRFTLYAGPKEYALLKAVGSNLRENIDFGWFMFGTWSLVRVLAEPMFILLTAIDGYVHNYGLSIIVLTLLIKTVFIPLTHKSYKSMKAMQAIQPQIKTIQKKYKDNKEKLSRETMALYKEHKINPLGGCLPIFVQIPFFIAFFNILYTAIELRQTPFMGWIIDLSAKDPYYVLPIIMGVSMFVQQKIQPTTLDPKQARIMLFLPVIFTFFFMNFPAGLVLYWLFNNLFTITQQFVTIRFLQKQTA
ncbi:MAG: membrane protein insertase YidC [Nitrospirae bacterium]|nr:membrane protein insertase YidC [Nitrospirota bacterium]